MAVSLDISKQNRQRLNNRLIHILHRPRKRANHQLRAKRANGRGIHSPYLFRFVTSVLNTPWPYYAFDALEALHPVKRRRRILTDRPKNDFKNQRLLFRIVHDRQPVQMLEIGNRTGLETQYMVHACPKAVCKSITYSPDAELESQVRTIVPKMEQLDFVLFNAPARMDRRMDEYRQCLQMMHEGSLMVINHLHQTPEQSLIWKFMRKSPQVRASMDLYSMGILFFRRDLPKCHLRIKL
jgi:hypothetical protein